MKIHFISIGGSAMHSLALALKIMGDEITGSDDEIFEPSKSRLSLAGILPNSMGWYPDKIHSGLDAVILGMHARDNNPELLKAKDLGLPVYSYPEYIFHRSKEKRRVVIGGSHGKTTCTSLIMHVLKYHGYDFDYLVGANVEGFTESVRISNSAPIIIIEGDEYLASAVDRRPKFILYKAHLALLTGIAWDHVNVFPSFEIYKNQFLDFLNSFEKDAIVVYCEEDEVLKSMVENFKPYPSNAPLKKIPYSLPISVMDKGKTDLVEEDGTHTPINLFGHHNLLNLEGSWLILKNLGLTRDQFLKAVPSFKGASKRLEIVAEKTHSTIFLDFAHAPSKIRASLDAVYHQFPDRKLIAVMELHTFSSLNSSFIQEYHSSMDLPDIALVYYNPHTLEHKKLPPLDKETVRRAFGRDDLLVLDDSDTLKEFLFHQNLQSTNLVFMSSGNFDGLDIRKVSHELLNLG
jgi:UDP-N-acetylmuramate: L-alanyl-gamma-D-glutamyl-meso-diaminopimelate ligase